MYHYVLRFEKNFQETDSRQLLRQNIVEVDKNNWKRVSRELISGKFLDFEINFLFFNFNLISFLKISPKSLNRKRLLINLKNRNLSKFLRKILSRPLKIPMRVRAKQRPKNQQKLLRLSRQK